MPDAPEDILSRVLAALAARLCAIPGVKVFTDRDDGNPIQPEERPALVARIVDDQLDYRQEMGEGAQVHALTIDIDIYVDCEMFENISAQHRRLGALVVAKLAEDWTLGGLLFVLTPASFTTSAEAVPDAGVAILTLSGQGMTAAGDWTQIIF